MRARGPSFSAVVCGTCTTEGPASLSCSRFRSRRCDGRSGGVRLARVTEQREISAYANSDNARSRRGGERIRAHGLATTMRASAASLFRSEMAKIDAELIDMLSTQIDIAAPHDDDAVSGREADGSADRGAHAHADKTSRRARSFRNRRSPCAGDSRQLLATGAP